MKRRPNHRKRADELFSKYIRERDGVCQAEGYQFECSGVLQCAHIHSRAYGLIRWNPDNAVALCQGHHYFFTNRPIEWSEWVEETFPGRYEVLKRRALSGEKPDAKAAAAALTILLDGISA